MGLGHERVVTTLLIGSPTTPFVGTNEAVPVDVYAVALTRNTRHAKSAKRRAQTTEELTKAIPGVVAAMFGALGQLGEVGVLMPTLGPCSSVARARRMCSCRPRRPPCPRARRFTGRTPWQARLRWRQRWVTQWSTYARHTAI